MISFDWKVLMWWAADKPVEKHNILYDIFAKDPERLQKSIIGLLVTELFLSLWLYFRQYWHVSSLEQVPPVLERLSSGRYTADHLNSTRNYAEDMVIHNAFKKLYTITLWLLAIYFNWINIAWNVAKDLTMWPEFINSEIERNVWFAMVCYTAYIIIHFPVKVHLVELEIKYGFFHFEETSYLVHHLVHEIKRIIPVGLIAGAVTWGMRTLDSKPFQQQMILIGSLSVLFILCYPTLEMWRMVRIESVESENPELKRTIDALCDRVGYPKEHVCFLHSSSRNMHTSAFYFGFLNYKKIIIYSRLIEGHTHSNPERGLPIRQLEAVVAHELGHWQGAHCEKTLLSYHFMQISTVLLVLWMRFKEIIFQAFGFTPDQYDPFSGTKTIMDDGGKEYLPGMLIAYYLILRLYHNFLQTLHQLQQREYEGNANEYAAELGYGTPLEQGLIKIVIDHEAFPSADLLYSLFHSNHPCLMERIQRLQEHQSHHHRQNSQNHQDRNNNSNNRH